MATREQRGRKEAGSPEDTGRTPQGPSHWPTTSNAEIGMPSAVPIHRVPAACQASLNVGPWPRAQGVVIAPTAQKRETEARMELLNGALSPFLADLGTRPPAYSHVRS